MKELRAKVNCVVAMGPGDRVFGLDRGIVENLDAVRAAQAGERATVTSGSVERDTRQDRGGNARDSKSFWQVNAGRIRINLVVGRKILEAHAELIQHSGRKSVGIIQHEILQ